MHSINEGESKRATLISPYLLWLIWVVWLFFLVPTVIALVQAPPPLPRYLLILAGILLFVFIYLWGTLQNARQITGLAEPAGSLSGEWARWLPVFILAAVSLLVTLLGSGYGAGNDWIELFFFTSGFAAGRFPTSQAVRAVVALMVVSAAAALLAGLGRFDIARAVSFVAVIGVVMISVVRAITTSRELHAAQEEIARLAVMNERLRIARDLHDLLGHNLSLIALKSELARRLLTTAPERAAVEISDIENAARTTLQEVREAVASYRQLTLSGELRGAREILAAARIAYLYEEGKSGPRYESSAPLEPLPPAVEAALAATVREGVTNVIRHSHAAHCTIRVTRDGRSAEVEVVDDGTASASPSSVGTADGVATGRPGRGVPVRGSGLSGLAERVAALGGRYESGPREEGGFRLAVSVPLAPSGSVNHTASMGSVSALPMQPAETGGVANGANPPSEKGRQL